MRLEEVTGEMTAESWTVIAATIALAAVILPGPYAIRRDLTSLTREVGDLRERMGLEIGDVKERLARMEGLFEGFVRRREDPKTA
ncbi:hypothetical protein [Candidatus Palauibacter sp.]|uniref:hypothetical protein n=1 Tax=Candidatus Palauibacter sp. TaxID=3101350 RepID=UPI003CC6DA74